MYALNAITKPATIAPCILPRTTTSAPDFFVPFEAPPAVVVLTTTPFNAKSVVGTSSVTTSLALAFGVGAGTPLYVNTV